MPRSGSTLLQSILSQRSDIYGSKTDPVLEYLYAARNNYTTAVEVKAQEPKLMLDTWRGFCWGGLKGYCEKISDKNKICLKSRGIGIHYKWFEAFMPYKPKIICCVRDIKNILTSMEKMFRNNQESSDNILNHNTMEGTTLEKRIDIWLSSQPIGLALERTKEMFCQDIAKNIHFIQYEQLTSNPEQVMNGIYSYLNILPYKHDFNNVVSTGIEDDAVYGLSNSLHKTRSKVEPSRDDSVDILGKGLCDWIDTNPKLNWYRDAFRYSLDK